MKPRRRIEYLQVRMMFGSIQTKMSKRRMIRMLMGRQTSAIPIIVASHTYIESIEKAKINCKNRFDANSLTLITYFYVTAPV
jgi:hypothetical protein